MFDCLTRPCVKYYCGTGPCSRNMILLALCLRQTDSMSVVKKRDCKLQKIPQVQMLVTPLKKKTRRHKNAIFIKQQVQGMSRGVGSFITFVTTALTKAHFPK